jgi:hypothetical protein
LFLYDLPGDEICFEFRISRFGIHTQQPQLSLRAHFVIPNLSKHHLEKDRTCQTYRASTA